MNQELDTVNRNGCFLKIFVKSFLLTALTSWWLPCLGMQTSSTSSIAPLVPADSPRECFTSPYGNVAATIWQREATPGPLPFPGARHSTLPSCVYAAFTSAPANRSIPAPIQPGHIAFSPDNKFFALRFLGDTVVWNVTENKVLGTLPFFLDIFGLIFTPDSRSLITTTDTGGFCLWDLTVPRLRASFVCNGYKPYDSSALDDHFLTGPVAVSHDRKQLAIGYSRARVRIFNLETGAHKQVMIHPALVSSIDEVTGIIFSSNDSKIGILAKDLRANKVICIFATQGKKEPSPLFTGRDYKREIRALLAPDTTV